MNEQQEILTYRRHIANQESTIKQLKSELLHSGGSKFAADALNHHLRYELEGHKRPNAIINASQNAATGAQILSGVVATPYVINCTIQRACEMIRISASPPLAS